MRLILLLVVMIGAVIFAAQNATTVTIDLFMWRIDASLAVVIACCFAIGVIAGVLFAVPTLYRMRSHKRRLQAQLADLGADDLSQSDTASGTVAGDSSRSTR
jgi:lipopolysaccharide assembly protein A